MRKKKVQKIIEQIEIVDFAAEGKGIAKHDGKVIFVPYVAKGDIIDVKILKSKKSFSDGEMVKLHSKSELRENAKCDYFGKCGGCKWQHVQYKEQLKFKETQVKDQLERIGHIDVKEYLSIKGCENIYEYRNKLEFAFSDKRWLTYDEINSGVDFGSQPALGYHIAGRFDKILDIENCHLMNDIHNEIRNFVKEFSIQHKLSFFNAYTQLGDMRNLMIRVTNKGEWMVLFSFGNPFDDRFKSLLENVLKQFPFIHSLLYVINQKKNDTIYDLPIEIFHGKDFIIENLGHLEFKISPKSFFQTNSTQAYNLYSITKNFAELSGNELVYDLYTGTGSIACFIADKAKKVVGIEYIEDAIQDAKINASYNNITNTDFFAGDMKDLLTDDFVNQHGKPDVIITDPPRAGMHEDVTRKMLEINPEKIVYVSCNPATQARDLAILSEKYIVEKSQAVDMFPHTHHVENVVLLRRK